MVVVVSDHFHSLYTSFFVASVFFLVGVALMSGGFSFYLIIGLFLCLLPASYWYYRMSGFLYGFLSLFLIVGAVLVLWDDVRFYDFEIPFNTPIEIAGIIVSDPWQRHDRTMFDVETRSSLRGRVRIEYRGVDTFSYGDEVRVVGVVRASDDESFRQYLRKERVVGSVKVSDVTVTDYERGYWILSQLYQAKRAMISIYADLLPRTSAGLLAGITLGDVSLLPDDILDVLSVSGIRHVVALSGSHMVFVAYVIGALFISLTTRRRAVWGTIAALFLFIAMTGFALSGIRAGIISSISSLAPLRGRIYSARNALAFAGVILVAFNPYVLLYDLGFQLSFLAVMGIVYVSPVLSRWLRVHRAHTMDWRTLLSVTIAAQIAVIPLLMISFQHFSITSILVNILILPVIPIIMCIGYFLVGAFYFFHPLATVFAWSAHALLEYIVLISHYGALWTLPISFSFDGITTSLYYVVLFGGSWLLTQKIFPSYSDCGIIAPRIYKI